MKHKQFNAFDKVLVRDAYDKWNCDMYSYYDKDEKSHRAIGFGWVLDNDILPYEGNEHLVGKVEEPEEEIELKEEEYGFFCNDIEDKAELWLFDMFEGEISNEEFCIVGISFKYFIPFSDFHPNDMKETKKHILCVKDGKIVKYKG